MKPITIPNISIPTIGIPTIGIPSVGFPSASGGGGLSWPAGMKEHIKAWYDPKKQGMTNYDVIESYAEDFTNWNYVKARGTVIVSQHKFIITECILNGLSIVEDIREPYSNLTVRITGITDNQEVLITDYFNGQHQIINTITEDGIYTIEDRHHFVGFGCNFVGTCNITIEQLPTSILKDLSGNGNHAYLYGGKGKLNSGMGVYQEDFSINTWNKTSFVFDYSHDYIKAKFKTINAGYRNVTVSNSNVSLNSMKIKVIIKGNSKDNRIMYSYADENGAQKVYYINNGETGIVPKSIATKTNDFLVGFRYNENNGDDCEITITQIPDYPDQLCYDGKMYAVCYGFPILTDYTVMAERAILDNSDIADWAFIAKRDYPAINGAFTFEKDIDDTSDNLRTISFGRTSVIYNPIKERSISYQTKNKYNGQDIIVGNVDDVDFLLIGAGILDTNLNLVKEKMHVAHGAIIVADRSFTEEEINWLKQNWDKI